MESGFRALAAIDRVLIEHGDRDAGGLPEFLATAGCEVMVFREKAMVRGQVEVSASDLVVGGLPAVRAALRQLGHRLPEANDYPDELTPFLRRRIWRTTMAGVRASLDRGTGPLFVKPRGRIKRFTGTVVRDARDWPLTTVSPSQPVWCSEVVEWLSEHRVFIATGGVLDIRPYWGDASTSPDIDVIGRCLYALRDRAPAGFALDVGVLTDGSTTVIEMNDGFSLGRYGLAPAPYVELLAARWIELVTAR